MISLTYNQDIEKLDSIVECSYENSTRKLVYITKVFVSLVIFVASSLITVSQARSKSELPKREFL